MHPVCTRYAHPVCTPYAHPVCTPYGLTLPTGALSQAMADVPRAKAPRPDPVKSHSDTIFCARHIPRPPMDGPERPDTPEESILSNA